MEKWQKPGWAWILTQITETELMVANKQKSLAGVSDTYGRELDLEFTLGNKIGLPLSEVRF